MKRAALLRMMTAGTAVSLFFTGCGSHSLPPATHGPTVMGGIPADEEQRLWARATEEQDRLDKSGSRADLPEMERYLERIIARLNPDPLPYGARFQVRIIVNPTLNAFAYPNGILYVHTGLLARAETEAQIATILSHEIIHAVRRHGYLHQRQVRTTTDMAATFTVGTLGLGGLIGGIGALAAVSGYSKDIEREADRMGFDLYVKAGYDPATAVTIFQLLADEARRTKTKNSFFFGSHPRLEERIASYKTLIDGIPAGRRANAVLEFEPYAPHRLRILPLNAEAALQSGDIDGALMDVRSGLALSAGAPSLLLIEADCLRRRRTNDDLARARDIYRQLTADHPGIAPAWRGLGLVAERQGDRPAAATAYRRYLELAPGASDRELITALLLQCDSSTP